jgi:hypothetical protein
MSDRHRDPLELWVGTWTPEEWIQREKRRQEQEAVPGTERAPEQAAPTAEAE